MNYDFKIPLSNEQTETISVNTGSILFVLGTNGSGKSSLLHEMYCQHPQKAIRITAHRQTWFDGFGITLSTKQLRETQEYRQSEYKTAAARWKDGYANYYAKTAVTQIIESRNNADSQIAKLCRENRMADAEMAAKIPPCDEVINELFRNSNLAITIQINDGENICAKSDKGEFSIAELSDGERSALILAAEVLTAPKDALIIIDEPERHLHRSIISPLLYELFGKRRDCAFVVSTHELMLPIDHPESQVFLIRDCVYSPRKVTSYVGELLPSNDNLGDDIKKDILGARQTILFVEGEKKSLDKLLYSIIFPKISVIPKSNCREVMKSVQGIREAENLHWVKAYGIIDGDGRDTKERESLQAKGIYAVPAYSVESIYYHEEVLKRVAEKHATSIGGNAAQRIANTKKKALEVLQGDMYRLCLRIVNQAVRQHFLSEIPILDNLDGNKPIKIEVDSGNLAVAEKTRFKGYLDAKDLHSIINRYPVRETRVLGIIAQELGFTDKRQYEQAVLNLLQSDQATLHVVRDIFGTLSSDIQA